MHSIGNYLFFALICSTFLPAFASLVAPPVNGRPRGVSRSKNLFYDSSKPFTCIDGSNTIPFENVNDDFCDCQDGSDEPGTSACSMLGSKFHCANKGHKPLNIPSSRVNDGICDCCDGTDEYSGTECPNQCKELGAKAREEARRLREVQMQGFQMRKEYSQQGQEKRTDRQGQVEVLKGKVAEASTEADRLKAIKEEAEKPEGEAKDAHRKKWEAEKAEKERGKAEEAFRILDGNSDGVLSIAEIQARIEFDKNSDGEVDQEEALAWLNGTADRDMEAFVTILWSEIKSVYVPPTEAPPAGEEPPTESSETPPVEGEQPPEEETTPEPPTPVPAAAEGQGEGDSDMPEYDEATQALIAEADKARAAFNDADKIRGDHQTELDNVQKLLEVDLGEEQEFFPLQGHCYEYTDREYTYKMCAFDRVSQQPKNGGSETSLGRWGQWTGSPNKYSTMKYENGESCWNGPQRSATIKLSCGTTNELRSASEPNRCEYEFEFVTPAVCTEPREKRTPSDDPDLHDEL